jgi:hypothetical protein
MSVLYVIELAIARGEAIDQVDEKADQLATSSAQFSEKVTSHTLRRLTMTMH